MSNLFQEYKASLKDISVEEPLDLYLFRPIAFILVKLIYRSSLTPNQISFLSILAGILAGFLFALGTPASFVYGGIMFGLTHILDLCDGMISRLKKTGTPTGRIIDGLADYVNGVAVYTGFGLGLSRSSLEFPISPILIVLFTGICAAIHSMIADYFRSEFMAHALGKSRSVQEERELFTSELKKMKQIKGKYLEKLLIKAYLKYSRVQAGQTTKKRKYDQKTYFKTNKSLLRLWNCLGASAHISMFMISSFLFKPAIFFYFVLGIANIGMLILWVFQVKTNKRIDLTANN